MRGLYLNRIARTTFWSFLTVVMAVPSVALAGLRSGPENLFAFGTVFLVGFLACRNFDSGPNANPDVHSDLRSVRVRLTRR